MDETNFTKTFEQVFSAFDLLSGTLKMAAKTAIDVRAMFIEDGWRAETVDLLSAYTYTQIVGSLVAAPSAAPSPDVFEFAEEDIDED